MTTGAGLLDDGVLLVSHGSRDPRAAVVVQGLVEAVAARTGRRVRAAHLDFTAPTPDAALRQMGVEGFASVRVVPLLFAPGHHLLHDVPAAVTAGGTAGGGGGTLRTSVAPGLVSEEPVTRALLLRALTDRLSRADAGAGLRDDGWQGAGRPFDGLVLAAAGSGSASARHVVEVLADDLGRAHGIPAVAAFASSVGTRPAAALEALRHSGVRRPAVASLFVAPGRLPDAVAKGVACAAAGAVVAAPLGTSGAFVDLLVAQVRHRSQATIAA